MGSEILRRPPEPPYDPGLEPPPPPPDPMPRIARRLVRAALPAVAFLLVARPALAQDQIPTARIDSVFLDVDRTDSPGCAVAVVRDGALVFADGYGSANLDHELPITPETVFYMGSVSKQFTAASVLLAARQGHLSLDDDVRTWIPELPDYGETITIRHLVHHTSGIRDYLTLQAIAGTFGGASDREVLELLARQKALNFAPGERYLYSNSGYFLLSEILERATGMSLREFADRWFFQPLGMRYTHFHDRPKHVVRNRATGYAPTDDGDFEMNHAWEYAQVGAGGLYSNVVDMARWETAFESGDVGEQGFTEAMLERGVLNNGDTLSYAFGLNLAQVRGLRVIAHGGSLAGFRAHMSSFPDVATSTIVLCNLATADPSGRARRVNQIVLADRLGPPDAAPPSQDDPPDPPTPPTDELAVYEGRYYSEELDTAVTLEVEGGELILDRNAERFPIRYSETDTFTGPDTLRFRRDDAGKVTGFTLDAGRANGLVFVKQAAAP